jgi:hypothetical protein
LPYSKALEDEDDMFLRVLRFSPNYTASQASKPYASVTEGVKNIFWNTNPDIPERSFILFSCNLFHTNSDEGGRGVKP